MSNTTIKDVLTSHRTGQLSPVNEPVKFEIQSRLVHEPTPIATQYETQMTISVRWFSVDRGFNLGQENAHNLIIRQIYGDLHKQLDLLRRELYACNMNKALAKCDEIQNNFGL